VVSEVSGFGSSARAAALEALCRAERGKGFLRDALHSVFDETGLPERDRALATQLATGVVRHRRTLRLILSHLRGRRKRASAIQPVLLAILELGAFQLTFLDRVPAYAAVNEAVEAARATVRGRRADRTAAFVNAMLRSLERLVDHRDPAGRPARNAVPHPDGGIVRLKAAVLPDPADGRPAFLGAAYSYPDWLVARWLKAFVDEAESVCRWNNRRPRTFARVNPMRHDAEELLRALQAEAPSVHPGPRAGSLDVSDLPAARLGALVREGVLTVQDPSAMAAVEALAPAAGEAVLDLCASPGTKTTQMAEAMGDQGCVIACDRSEEKLRPLRDVVTQRCLKSVAVCLSGRLDEVTPKDGFDAAIVDVPCSNTGVLARRVEARWRLRPADLEELPRRQSELLARAAEQVRPGGRLIYSTCSLESEENDDVIRGFLGERADWVLRRRELILPSPDHDGAYWALLHRQQMGSDPHFSRGGF